VPIISDPWKGLGTIFRSGSEVLVARSPEEVLRFVREIPEEKRVAIGERARARVLSSHTAAHRAEQLERYILSALAERLPRLTAAHASGVRAVQGD
jgi:spore maturation protein CgeB